MDKIETVEIFEDIRDQASVDDTTAAILTLAAAIRDGNSKINSERNAENFGHELAIALKDVLERPVRIEKA